MPQKQTHTQTMSTRAFSTLPSTVDVDSRSFDITITTETPVRTVISDPREPEKMIEVDEVLSVAGLDLSRADRMPLVDCHDTEGGLGKILGKVDDIRIEGTTVVGRAVLNTRNADLAADIAGGFYGQVSAGYVVNAYVIEERADDVPLATAVMWTLQEASLVAVGADPNSSIRGARKFPAATVRSSETKEKSMDYEDLVVAAEDAINALAEAERKRKRGEGDDELEERARKILGEEEDGERSRGKRSGETEEEEERKRGKRDDADEEKELARTRSIARTYGTDMVKLVGDLSALGMRAADIKTAVAQHVAKRGAPEDSTRSAAVKPAERETPTLDTNAIFAKRNARSRSGR